MRRRDVLPDWIIIATVVALAVGLLTLAGLVLAHDGSTHKLVVTATPTVEPTASPAPTSATPTVVPATPTPVTPQPTVERVIVVSVYNNTTTSGLAARTLAKVASLGWPTGVSGTWRGNVPRTTVYYPEGGQAQARLLARDLGIARIAPRVAPMHAERLTVILTGRR